MSPFRQYLLETSLAVFLAVAVVAIVVACGKSDIPPVEVSAPVVIGPEPVVVEPAPVSPRLFDLAGNPRTFPGPAGALAQ